MLDQLEIATILSQWWGQAAFVIVFYLLAWLIHQLAGRIASRFVRFNRFASQKRQWRPERLATLRGLTASVITFLAFTVATLFTLSLFVDADTLVWMVGLFSAAFGLGARPLISDFLTGIGFMFEDTFDVGEKVELLGAGGNVEGVIEAVNLRTSLVRAPTGELLTIPNGEIRLVRNFSRGRFSTADIRIKIASTNLQRAIPILEELGQEAVTLLPNLLEPWQVISSSGEMGQQTELTLLAKSRFGQAAEMRPRLLALVQERLNTNNISLAD